MSGLADGADLLSMAVEEGDADTVASVARTSPPTTNGSRSSNSAACVLGRAGQSQRLPGHPGRVGGTEAQIGPMLLPHVPRWGEQRGFRTELMEVSPARWRASVGDHPVRGRIRLRLAAHRDRCTSAGAQIAVRFGQPSSHLVQLGVRLAGSTIPSGGDQPADLRIDVYRASGAGGQHVNKDRVSGAYHPPGRVP